MRARDIIEDEDTDDLPTKGFIHEFPAHFTWGDRVKIKRGYYAGKVGVISSIPLFNELDPLYGVDFSLYTNRGRKRGIETLEFNLSNLERE